jgi:hypothetical protein
MKRMQRGEASLFPIQKVAKVLKSMLLHQRETNEEQFM